MAFTTQTIYSTQSAVVVTTPTATIESTVTFTTVYESTYLATLGETLTIYPPPLLVFPVPSSNALSITLPATLTVTVTDLAVIVENPSNDNNVVSTWTISGTAPTPSAPATGSATPTPTPYVLVVETGDHGTGWSSWSSSQRGGLIAGVVIAGILLLVSLVWLAAWCCSRRKMWIASDWSTNSQPEWTVNQPGQMVRYGYNGWGIRGGGSIKHEKIKVVD